MENFRLVGRRVIFFTCGQMREDSAEEDDGEDCNEEMRQAAGAMFHGELLLINDKLL
ncbi:hypothetical protein HMPREF0908_1594 [Selenomonas flueggei ATCC 43531]|uniref:Uncharacterized protein n=1 Tax=Selenomonas flueggei ATCC 43531 TaxID=638302 RepID=C4V500_9FIRM|nr:hypothetical protein HMPREF0908_1594 [Selenomonas flueggei ATCC 43531]